MVYKQKIEICKLNLSCFNCSATTRLHCFQNLQLRQKWLDVIPNIKEENIDINFRLCSAHFDNKYLTKSDTLKWNAIPSKFYIDGFWITITGIPINTIPNSVPKEPAVSNEIEISNAGDLDSISYQIDGDNELIITQRRKFGCVSDIDMNVLYSPKTSRRALILCKAEFRKQRKIAANLRNRLRRLKTTLSEMKKFVECLEADGIIRNRPLFND